jgi:hypothetical protein
MRRTVHARSTISASSRGSWELPAWPLESRKTSPRPFPDRWHARTRDRRSRRKQYDQPELDDPKVGPYHLLDHLAARGDDVPQTPPDGDEVLQVVNHESPTT